MRRRVVLRVSINCLRCKVVVQKAVAKFEGVDSVSWNVTMRTITVVGDVDAERLSREIWVNGKTARIVEDEIQQTPPARPELTRHGDQNPRPRMQEPRGQLLLSTLCRECELQTYIPCQTRYCPIL